MREKLLLVGLSIQTRGVKGNKLSASQLFYSSKGLIHGALAHQKNAAQQIIYFAPLGVYVWIGLENNSLLQPESNKSNFNQVEGCCQYKCNIKGKVVFLLSICMDFRHIIGSYDIIS